MQLQINGQEISVPDDIDTVTDLLKHLGLHARLLVVEHNRTILQQDQHGQTRLAEGHRLEIVHFVGGG